MKIKLGTENVEAEHLIPPSQPDGSGVGINYVDAYLKPLQMTLEDGRKVAWKRRGLKITLAVGDKKGEALLRKLDHGPEVRGIVRKALEEAAIAAGAKFTVEEGSVYLDLA